jgi:hypothetical protein
MRPEDGVSVPSWQVFMGWKDRGLQRHEEVNTGRTFLGKYCETMIDDPKVPFHEEKLNVSLETVQ